MFQPNKLDSLKYSPRAKCAVILIWIFVWGLLAAHGLLPIAKHITMNHAQVHALSARFNQQLEEVDNLHLLRKKSDFRSILFQLFQVEELRTVLEMPTSIVRRKQLADEILLVRSFGPLGPNNALERIFLAAHPEGKRLLIGAAFGELKRN